MTIDSDFLAALRSAIETGDFEQLAGIYAGDATFEGFLPGRVREATGPAAITGRLAHELGPLPTLVAGPGNSGRPPAGRGRPPTPRQSCCYGATWSSIATPGSGCAE